MKTIILTVDEINSLLHGEVIDKGDLQIARENINQIDITGSSVSYQFLHGDTFSLDGKQYKVEAKDSYGCKGCVFYQARVGCFGDCAIEHRLACGFYERDDCKNVVFKEIEE